MLHFLSSHEYSCFPNIPEIFSCQTAHSFCRLCAYVCVCACVCACTCMCVCMCVFENLPVKEGGREHVHCTLSLWRGLFVCVIYCTEYYQAELPI